MKKLVIFAAALFIAAPAFADNITIVRDPENRVVRDLPGNAQIVTGGRDMVVIEGDNKVWRNIIHGSRNRVQAPNYGSVSSTCPVTLSVSDRNKCVREFMKAQEDIRRRYND